MKRLVKFLFAISMGIALAGCTFGNGMICGPQTPIAYCDHEAYEKLAHPTPYLSYWEQPQMTMEKRKQDALTCGAPDTVYFTGTEFGQNKIKAAQLSGETDRETTIRLSNNWQLCMLKKGYHYTGNCDSKFTKNTPACRAL